jgi:hypothetical protein
MSFSFKPPPTRIRLVKAITDSLMMAPKETLALVSENLLKVVAPEEQDKLLLSMALHGIDAASDAHRTCQTELKATHDERGARQRAGIAAAKERKAGEASKKTPPDDTGDAGAPPAPHPTGRVGCGGTVAIDPVESSLADQDAPISAHNAPDVTSNAFGAPFHQLGPDKAPASARVPIEPTRAVQVQRQSAASSDHAEPPVNIKPAAAPTFRDVGPQNRGLESHQIFRKEPRAPANNTAIEPTKMPPTSRPSIQPTVSRSPGVFPSQHITNPTDLNRE